MPIIRRSISDRLPRIPAAAVRRAPLSRWLRRFTAGTLVGLLGLLPSPALAKARGADATAGKAAKSHGAASEPAHPAIRGNAFDPRRDGFAFANETVFAYGVDEAGHLHISARAQPPRFAHRCLCMVRGAI